MTANQRVDALRRISVSLREAKSKRLRHPARRRRLKLELLECRRLLTSDFGDAPLPYPTLLSENGARHDDSGPTLGPARDTEPVGIHSDAADADDLSGSDDEDGVTCGQIRIGALGATAIVNVQGAAGKLDAWIDFNRDGSWFGPAEQIANAVDVVVGDNTINFDVPSDALAGTTYARFRLSTVGDLRVTGFASDGEVEDHAVTIIAPAANGYFRPQTPISTSADGARSVHAADIDGDGDMDVLGAAANDDQIAWYENIGGASFEQHVIDSSADSPNTVVAVDLDGDGDMDVLASSSQDDTVAWHRNDGSENFTKLVITVSANDVKDVFPADLDGDGDFDVLVASEDNRSIAWFENDGSESFTQQPVSTSSNDPSVVRAVDVDTDGDLDVISGSFIQDGIEWFENDGNEVFTRRVLFESNLNFSDLSPIDMDGDGDMDVVAASYGNSTIVWLENDGNEVFARRTLSTAQSGVSSIFATDHDGDGDIDIAAAVRFRDKVSLFKNDGNQNFSEWTLSSSVDQAISVFSGDIDGDGDMDVLGAAYTGDRFVWFENTPSPDFGDAPDPYPTLRDDNGALHENVGPTLGATRDPEADGQPSDAADGDSGDEDGVSFSGLRVGALDATATVNVQGSAAKLDAWIDFNGDGSWAGPDEQVADSVDVAIGDNFINFDVPANAILGSTYARFRLSTLGDLAFAGPADDGEVEDYLISIDAPTSSDAVFVGHEPISVGADGARSVHAADVDGDGDLDLLSASYEDDKVAWHENDGSQNFTEHVVSSSSDGATDVITADVDGDGDLDVLTASFLDDTIAWHENDGSGSFMPHSISTSADGASSVHAADIDLDGDVDVVSTSQLDATLAWYENDGSGVFSEHLISTFVGSASSIHLLDYNRDGDVDVVLPWVPAGELLWYTNYNSGSFASARIAYEPDVSSLSMADVDRDGDFDVLVASASGDTLAWLEKPVTGRLPYTRHAISTSADGPAMVNPADLDGDGHVDILIASRNDDKIAWYQHNGDATFAEHVISTEADAATDAIAADVDGDGDLDVISASELDDEVTWYENTTPDLGDAPAPYPTLLADDGAIHDAIGPTLGPTRDTEPDGQPTGGGDGGDEDGVMFGTLQLGATIAGVNIDLQNASTAKVDAWIDFGGDGTWDAGDQILDSVVINGGQQTLNYAVPPGAVAGDTFARVRVSSNGDLDPTGFADDGEVEDYLVTIVASVTPPKVHSVEINGGDPQRSRIDTVRVTFDQIVDINFSGSDVFEFINSDTLDVVVDIPVVSAISDKTVVDFTFTPGASVTPFGSLADGNYQLTIDASLVTKSGVELDGDGDGTAGDDHLFGPLDSFFRRYGDSSGNGVVDLLDFADFRRAFSKNQGDIGFKEEFDSDGDDTIGLLDFAAFRRNFGS